ncbi:hypothetical protein [Vibrio sonorensis]|uniref:hypothetical protein n=1 Tax=Vibrio sonorensis TaxID=1004316 RepID=UPI0008D958D5|nr:hypothetical protein [Vibrio sonorensis]
MDSIIATQPHHNDTEFNPKNWLIDSPTELVEKSNNQTTLVESSTPEISILCDSHWTDILVC